MASSFSERDEEEDEVERGVVGGLLELEGRSAIF